MTTLNDARARRRARGRRARGDRRHRVRPARAPARVVRRRRESARSSRPTRSRSSTACATCSPRAWWRAARSGTTRSSRPTSTSATCPSPNSSCWPTRRRRAACCSSVPAGAGRSRSWSHARARGTLAQRHRRVTGASGRTTEQHAEEARMAESQGEVGRGRRAIRRARPAPEGPVRRQHRVRRRRGTR